MSIFDRLPRINIPNPLASLAADNAAMVRMDCFKYYLDHCNDLSSGRHNLANLRLKKAIEMGLTPEEQRVVSQRRLLPIFLR